MLTETGFGAGDADADAVISRSRALASFLQDPMSIAGDERSGIPQAAARGLDPPRRRKVCRYRGLPYPEEENGVTFCICMWAKSKYIMLWLAFSPACPKHASNVLAAFRHSYLRDCGNEAWRGDPVASR